MQSSVPEACQPLGTTRSILLVTETCLPLWVASQPTEHVPLVVDAVGERERAP